MNFSCYLKAGEATACAPIDFVKEARKRTTLIDPSITDEALQKNFQRNFEGTDRWEFISTDEDGRTVAVMVLYIDEHDIHKAEPVLNQMCSNSLVPGALIPGYRYMVNLARERGIRWIYTTRSEGEAVNGTYKKVK